MVKGDYLCATFVPTIPSLRGNLSVSERTHLNGRTGRTVVMVTHAKELAQGLGRNLELEPGEP